MATERKTDFVQLITTLQCRQLVGLGAEQKTALHKFKEAVAKAFGECERSGVPARGILTAMLVQSTTLNTGEIAREMTGGAPARLKNHIGGGGPCAPNFKHKFDAGQLKALHDFKAAVADAFGDCEQIVAARVILAVFSQHAAELNEQDFTAG